MCSYHCLPIEIHLQIARGSSTLATPGGALDNILSKESSEEKVIHYH